MKKIKAVMSNERLITPGGSTLIGQVLGRSKLIKKANRIRSHPQIKNGGILLTEIRLLTLGKPILTTQTSFTVIKILQTCTWTRK